MLLLKIDGKYGSYAFKKILLLVVAGKSSGVMADIFYESDNIGHDPTVRVLKQNLHVRPSTIILS